MNDRSSERIEYINTDGAADGFLFDLSATGVCCHYRKRVEKDSFVSVKINELTLKAKVIYCQERKDGFRLGLQYVQVSAEQQKTLNESVEKFSRGVEVSCGIVDKP